MALSSQLLFFFSALGAFNGLFLALYLWFSKPFTTEKRFLAALLLAISLRISKSIWFYFDPTIGKQFLQIGLSACFLIGPFLYFYIACVTKQLERLTLHWKTHISLLFVIIIAVGTLYPYQSNVDLWGVFYKFINWSWFAYLVASCMLLFPTLSLLITNKSALAKSELVSVNVFFGVSIIWLAYFTASYTSYIVGALTFSFILYMSVSTVMLKTHYKKEVRYANKKIEELAANELLTQLNVLMETEKLYKNANLTLGQLARKMQVSVPQLSQFLNDNMGKSFSSYINEWRIKEAKQLLITEPNMTMEVIAELSGYNAQSTFYSAFKQFEQLTPAKYRHSMLNNS